MDIGFIIQRAWVFGLAFTLAPSAGADAYPPWFTNPDAEIPNAINAASCVRIPAGHMEIARKQAVANGRKDIASTLQTRVKALEESFEELQSEGESYDVIATFSTVQKTITHQVLSGAKAVRFARILDQGVPSLCALVSLDNDKVNRFFHHLTNAANLALDKGADPVEYQMFLDQKVTQELGNHEQ